MKPLAKLGVAFLLIALAVLIHHMIVADGVIFELEDALHHEFFAAIFAVAGILLIITTHKVMNLKYGKKWIALGLTIALITVWIIAIPNLSPYAWVCPTCVLPNVNKDTVTTFNIHLCNGAGSDPINDFRVDYAIYGPNAGTTFYCDPANGGAAKGSINVPPSVSPGQCVDVKLEIDFSDWNTGDDYHLLIYPYDGTTPVLMEKSIWDWTYVDLQECHDRVDSMCPGGICTCVDKGLTKTPSEAYTSFCGGVAWGFNIKSYGGSVTVSIGMVRPSIG